MPIAPRTFARLAVAVAFAAPLALHAAPAKPGPGPAVVAPTILPVPLNPVVPASQRLCAAKAPSGLGTSVLRPGTGARPSKDDVTLISYIGYLAADGTVFDQNPQGVLPVDGVIPGFSEGIQGMAKGAVHRICVPAALGYGAVATGPIPANADLVFQVELIDFKSRAELEAMQKAEDEAAAKMAPPAPAEKPQ